MYNIRNPSKCIQKCLQYIFLKKLQFSERWTSHQANSDTTLKHNITLQSFTQVFGENNLKNPKQTPFHLYCVCSQNIPAGSIQDQMDRTS